MATQVFSLYFDKTENVLWIGTVRNGLFSLNLQKGEFRQYLPESAKQAGIGGDWVRSFVKDNRGYLWMSADPTGLSRFDYRAHPDSAFRNFSIKHGLPSNHTAEW